MILDDVLDFQAGTARDDIAVVAVRVPPLPSLPPLSSAPAHPNGVTP